MEIIQNYRLPFVLKVEVLNPQKYLLVDQTGIIQFTLENEDFKQKVSNLTTGFVWGRLLESGLLDLDFSEEAPVQMW